MTIELGFTTAIVAAFVLGLGVQEVCRFSCGLVGFGVEKVVFWSPLALLTTQKFAGRCAPRVIGVAGNSKLVRIGAVSSSKTGMTMTKTKSKKQPARGFGLRAAGHKGGNASATRPS